jgi:hypothetical protein
VARPTPSQRTEQGRRYISGRVDVERIFFSRCATLPCFRSLTFRPGCLFPSFLHFTTFFEIMFSKAIVSSLLLAALANGLVIKRDEGYDSSTPPALSLPTPATPPPLSLPNPSFSLSLPPLSTNPTSTPTALLLSSSPLPPVLLLPSVSPLPSVVTTTVYIYPTQCSPTGTPPPAPGPSGSGVPDSVATLSNRDFITPPPETQPTPIALPQATPLWLPKARRDDSVESQLRALQQQVVNTWVDLGRGNSVLPVVGQLESLITQATTPGADGAALLKQAQDLVNN